MTETPWGITCDFAESAWGLSAGVVAPVLVALLCRAAFSELLPSLRTSKSSTIK